MYKPKNDLDDFFGGGGNSKPQQKSNKRGGYDQNQNQRRNDGYRDRDDYQESSQYKPKKYDQYNDDRSSGYQGGGYYPKQQQSYQTQYQSDRRNDDRDYYDDDYYDDRDQNKGGNRRGNKRGNQYDQKPYEQRSNKRNDYDNRPQSSQYKGTNSTPYETKSQNYESRPQTSTQQTRKEQSSSSQQQSSINQVSTEASSEQDQYGYDEEIYDYYENEYLEDEGDQNIGDEDDNLDEIEKDLDIRSGDLKILMVAEKNSIALAITKALTQNFRQNKGRNACYYFTSSFRGQKASFIVTATNGHVFNRDFPSDYADWEKVDPFQLFKAKTIKKPTPKTGTVRVLQNCAKNCDYLLLWLDNDREGENICFEVEDVCRPFMRKNFRSLRAKFSSITSQELVNAFKNIKNEPNLRESQSVDARQIIDLKVGVAFSRFQTMYFSKKYNGLKDKLITFGPCQTPTLGFCVQRHEEIENFKPKTFYYIQVQLQSNTGFRQNAEWDCERLFNEKEARALFDQVKQVEYLQVVDAKSNSKSKPRPEGINTVQMLKYASSCLGIGPQQAMHIAEHLYLSGYISYPRTETTAFPKGFNTEQIIQALKGVYAPDIAKYVDKLLKQGINNPRGGVDVGDHPPITPTNNVPKSLAGPEKSMYEYITKMFLASHSKDCTYVHSKLKVKPPNLNVFFKITGNKVVDPGFSAIATWLSINDDSFDPQKYIENNRVKASNYEFKSGLTQPPGYLSESDLIALMEHNGIGTDASMATHINNISVRSYVKVEAGRQLVPTELGLSLVRGYKKIDPDLVAPQLRSNIEKQCDSIAKGQARFEEVVDKVIGLFEEKFLKFKANINRMDEIFGDKIHKISQSVANAASRGDKAKAAQRYRKARQMRKKDEDNGPSDVIKEITLAELVTAQLKQQAQPQVVKKVEVKEAPKQAPVKNFKSKKDGDLLY